MAVRVYSSILMQQVMKGPAVSNAVKPIAQKAAQQKFKAAMDATSIYANGVEEREMVEKTFGKKLEKLLAKQKLFCLYIFMVILVIWMKY